MFNLFKEKPKVGWALMFTEQQVQLVGVKLLNSKCVNVFHHSFYPLDINSLQLLSEVKNTIRQTSHATLSISISTALAHSQIYYVDATLTVKQAQLYITNRIANELRLTATEISVRAEKYNENKQSGHQYFVAAIANKTLVQIQQFCKRLQLQSKIIECRMLTLLWLAQVQYKQALVNKNNKEININQRWGVLDLQGQRCSIALFQHDELIVQHTRMLAIDNFNQRGIELLVESIFQTLKEYQFAEVSLFVLPDLFRLTMNQPLFKNCSAITFLSLVLPPFIKVEQPPERLSSLFILTAALCAKSLQVQTDV